MKDKLYDPKAEATHLAKVLKYNPEYIQNPAKLDELALVIQLRLEAAFEAGKSGKISGEVIDVSPPSTSGVTKEWIS